MRIKAFIFDMDGVMLDSEPLQLRSFNQVLQQSGNELSMDEFKKTYMGLRDTQICEKMIEAFSLSISAEEFVTHKRSAYLTIIKEENVPPTPGLVEAVDKLSALLPLAIASSSQVDEIETITQAFGIRNKFQVIQSAHQVPHGKPAPDVYLKTSELLGIAPSLCGVIEDTRAGVRSAKAAGMKCIGITTTHSAEELSEADRIVASFEELLPVVEEL